MSVRIRRKSRGPEHHVPTNSYHDRRGRSPPELSFTTATRVFDAIREHTARSIYHYPHPGFFHLESSRILAGTNTSQAARSPRRVYDYPFHFNLPSNVPPTTKTEHGSFTRRLNASVKQNSSRSLLTLFIAACKEVEVVYSSSDDELGNLDTDFDYIFTIPRNSSPLGEIFPVQFEAQSLRRIRTYRIAVHVYLNEYLEYFFRSGVSIHTETSRAMITQLNIFKTPLPTSRPSGHPPGVDSEGGMQRNRKSNVGIDHLMEVHIRVEKGDDGVATGRDFFIHVPMRMLSVNPAAATRPFKFMYSTGR
ncbi:hypothetical protein EDC04DRAFT_2839254 [Pisolithus marmoratus]|nr:hypothetical protein EDC04DRAFT_2839254 [Pisolithus marmoratus]